MTVLDPITLDEAEMSVAIANTPIFLARRLRDNPAVLRALEIYGLEKIFSALVSIAGRKPATLREVTEAYFYLSALSFGTDLSFLKRATVLTVPHIKWFAQIAEYYWATATSTTTTNTRLAGNLILQPAARTMVANTTTIIRP